MLHRSTRKMERGVGEYVYAFHNDNIVEEKRSIERCEWNYDVAHLLTVYINSTSKGECVT